MHAKLNSILVLEDDASQLATLKVLLEDEGLDVTGCSRGAEALQLLRDDGFAVAIIDLSVPDISQQQLLAELAPLSPHVSVIINTGHGSYESAKTSANLGVFAFVEKMGDPKELLLKVHKAVHAQAERLAIRAIERERERAQLYFEMAGVIMVAIDKRRKVTSVNKKGAEFVGLDQEQIVGLDWFETFIPEHDRRRVISGFEDLMAGRIESAEYFENAVITTDGREHLVAWHNVLLYDDEGNIAGTLSSGQDITDLRKAEEERERSREFLESVMNAYPGNVAVLDSEGRIIMVNEGWERFGRENGLGQQYAETGVDYLDVCDGAEGPWSEEAPTVAGHLRRMIAGEDIDFQVEYPCHSPDVKRWFQIQARPFAYDGKRWIVMAHIDITQRKEAEELLRDREERLRLAMESANECSWELDVPSDRVDFRETAVELLGYEPCEVEDANIWWKEQLHPDDRQRVERVVGDYLEGRTANYSCEFRLRHRDGYYVWIASNGRITQRDDNGRPLRMVGIHRDITEQEELRCALIESEKKYRSIVETAQEGIWVLDADGATLYVNSRMAEMLGYTREEMKGVHLFEFVDEHAQRIALEKLNSRKSVLKEVHEFVFRRKDGTELPALVSTNAMFAEDGTYAGTLGMVADITELKRMQKNQADQLEELNAIYNNVPVVIMLVDRHRRIRKANTCAADFADRPSGAMIGLYGGQALRCLHALDVPEGCGFGPACETCPVRLTVLDTLETGRSHHQVQATVSVAVGDRQKDLTVLVSTAAISIEREPMVLVSLMDITSQVQAQRTVHRHQRQLRSLAARLSLVEERERRRIALWLHDEIAQRLAVSQIELQDLRRSRTDISASEKIDRLSGEIDELMAEIRSETFELGTPTLYLVGLEAGVESWLKRVVGEKYGLRTSLAAEGDFSDLDKDLVLVLFRSTRELLANVVKHARAEKVEVSLRRNRDQVEIEVRDDGVGFDPAEVLSVDDETESQSFGLVSVREQTEHLGGRISLDSGENKGTCIRLAIPIKSQDNKD